MGRIMRIMCLLVLLAGGRASAKDFYSDGNIITGDLWDSVYIHDTLPSHTTINMTGGEVFGGMYGYDRSTLNLSGGRVNIMSSYDNSILNMTAGILNNLYSYEYSTANISGNTLDGPFNISARDNSIINFSGTADADHVDAFNTVKLNILGGTINHISARNDGVLNIYSGDISNVWSQDNAVINVFGKELRKWPTGGAFGYGFVYGYYNDWSSFYFSLESTESYSHVNLIPEPATILLLVAGSLFLRKKE
ncbi:MAG: PEP-CTERM sorting domain-containing protein [Sedimentisphaerales bacterium]